MGEVDELRPLRIDALASRRRITLVPVEVWQSHLASAGRATSLTVTPTAVIDREDIDAAIVRAAAIRALDAEAEASRVDVALARIRDDEARVRARYEAAAARLEQRETTLAALIATEARFDDAAWVARLDTIRDALADVEAALRDPEPPGSSDLARAEACDRLVREGGETRFRCSDRPALAAAEAELADARRWVAGVRAVPAAVDERTVRALESLHGAVVCAMERVETAVDGDQREAARVDLERAIDAERAALVAQGVRTFPEFLFRTADPTRSGTEAARLVSNEGGAELRAVRTHGARLRRARERLRNALEAFDAFGEGEQFGSRAEAPEVVARRAVAAHGHAQPVQRVEVEAQVAELVATVRGHRAALDEHEALIDGLERQRAKTLTAIDDASGDVASALAELTITCGASSETLAIVEALDGLSSPALRSALGALEALPADLLLVTKLPEISEWALGLGATALAAAGGSDPPEPGSEVDAEVVGAREVAGVDEPRDLGEVSSRLEPTGPVTEFRPESPVTPPDAQVGDDRKALESNEVRTRTPDADGQRDATASWANAGRIAQWLQPSPELSPEPEVILAEAAACGSSEPMTQRCPPPERDLPRTDREAHPHPAVEVPRPGLADDDLLPTASAHRDRRPRRRRRG